ncbi:flippase-like domain-containing protein [Brachybacterium sp. MASK1Z-5]|uniref:Flippase-like domain-containing protein n=1 Tax=Brachybacterium halotolerans TaxID=2795215 RepID=A0ABS1BF04_9MICO|nr:lysylphosphatidylglycerol synthase domain-containing protein [Brachybacterium halotolerans]MBK0332742.1 flippase-like domain-containing protein [Brachybacterium halotolerans]
MAPDDPADRTGDPSTPPSRPSGASPATPPAGADGLLASLLGLTRADRPSPGRLVLAACSLVLLVVLLVWLLPRALRLDPPQLLDALAGVPTPVLLAALLLGVLAVLLEALGARAALPGAPVGAVVSAQAAAWATALAVPGGSLLGIAITGAVLRRRGTPMRTIVTGIAAFSAVDLLLGGVAIPLAALASYAALGSRHDLPGTLGATIVAAVGVVLTVAVLVLLAHRPTTVRILDALAPTIRTVLALVGRGGDTQGEAREEDRASTGEDPAALVLEARDRVARILRRRWAGILVPMLAARAAQGAVLWIAADALASGTGPLALLGVFLIGRALSLVPVTPGGGGVTETAVALLLTSLGAAPAAAGAIALVLGGATWAVPLVLGGALGIRELMRRRA